MGPKVKKSPKNGFSFFLEEYVKNERERGRSVSYRIAAEECTRLWQELSTEKKKEYNEMATVHKHFSKEEKDNKFTSSGVTVAEFEKMEAEQRLKTMKADMEIKTTISELDADMVKTHLFYIIHCNYYCKTQGGTYVPGEMAIVEFNLQSGIRRTFHTLINPGPIPLGYAFEAKHTIETIHGLPYPPYDEGDSDYFGILDKVLNFLEPGKMANGRYPPLYCIENNIKASENILKSLSENYNEENSFFRVFLLHKMFFWLKSKCVENIDEENVGFAVIANAESEISKDMFCYVPGISCSFHISSDEKYHNCSLSVVQRYVYVICDHCCQYVGVTLIPGQHCRLMTDVNRKADSRPRKDRKTWSSSVSNDAREEMYEVQSSYCGDMSSFGWNRDGAGACSFLHEELDSKFDDLEVSSVGSVISRNTVSTTRAKEVKSEEDPDSDEEDFFKVVSLGRGSSRYAVDSN